jgi:hypothetical protein
MRASLLMIMYHVREKYLVFAPQGKRDKNPVMTIPKCTVKKYKNFKGTRLFFENGAGDVNVL